MKKILLHIQGHRIKYNLISFLFVVVILIIINSIVNSRIGPWDENTLALIALVFAGLFFILNLLIIASSELRRTYFKWLIPVIIIGVLAILYGWVADGGHSALGGPDLEIGIWALVVLYSILAVVLASSRS